MTYANPNPTYECVYCENLKRRYAAVEYDNGPRQVRCKRGHIIVLGCDCPHCKREESQ